nr:protein-L-isoaspartate O-methyltransferase [Streptomyces tailanensis]
MPEPAPPAPTTFTAGDDAEAAAARAAMVDRLHETGDLSPGPVADALRALPRQALMPQAYMRTSAPGETPPRWELLDWSVPEDRPALLRVLHSGDSVAVQHEGEPLLSRARGPRSGGAMTAMSSVLGMTARLLQELDLRPEQRVLDVGTGAGVTAAVVCFVSGDKDTVTIDLDRHITDAAAQRLAGLGYRPTAATGDGEEDWPPGAPYDRVFLSFAVPRVPGALVEQLAPRGRLLATVSTRSPSWPGLAVITKTEQGHVQGELRAVEFGHRAGWGRQRLCLSTAFREQIAIGVGVTVRGQSPPPPVQARGMWLALDHLHPGLVRDFGAEQLQIGAPECGSWVRVRPDGEGTCSITQSGPRAIWEEIEQIADRWLAAGEPSSYRIEFDADGTQRATAGHGRSELCWTLPNPPRRPTPQQPGTRSIRPA